MSKIPQEAIEAGVITDEQLSDILACQDDVSTARIKICRLIHAQRRADAARAEGAEVERLRKMVERRDEFIIGKGLWGEFQEAKQ